MVSLIPAIVLDDRNQSLAELRVSEARFRNLTMATFEGVLITERGCIVDANDQALKMFGYDRDRR